MRKRFRHSQISIKCTSDFCQFQDTCEKVLQTFKDPLTLSLNLVDSDQNQGELKFDLFEMLMPGDKCNLPVVKSTQRGNGYYLGQMFMRKHVIVFDNSHRDERNENYMTIGLGLKNSKAIDKAVLKQYDETVEGYMHSKEDSSVSANEEADNIDGLQQELETLQKEIGDINNGIAEFTKVYEQSEKALENAKARNVELQKEMDEAKKNHRAIAAHRTEMAETYKVLSKNLSDVMNEAVVLKQEKIQLDDENKELAANHGKIDFKEEKLNE